MNYRESKLDKDNRKWFANDNSKQSLVSISLVKGVLRGLTPFVLQFKYPITAIAGKNGSGKSTLLGIASCGFHNHKKGYKLKSRNTTYYTFSDFFVQSTEEVPPQGISIFYGVRHNDWKITATNKQKEGINLQQRTKKEKGRWNDYATRVHRDVVFFGIDRVVPHAEKSVSRSYRNSFKKRKPYGWENQVKDTVGRILNKKYDNFEYAEYSKYRLPIVSFGGTTYSGFNMGAGENALFEIFSTIYSCSEGALIVVDEIELGLHVEAQKKLINELKIVSFIRKIQIICTTHSKHIFEALPLDARIYIENFGGKTIITENISSEFAFGKLAACNSNELDILVEDTTAFQLVNSLLPLNFRCRANISVIGSWSALARQMASILLSKSKKKFVVIFDGDQATNIKNIKVAFLNATEIVGDKTLEEAWFESHICFLPGKEWPEKWILLNSSELVNQLAAVNKCHPDDMTAIIELGLQANKHSEFYAMAEQLNVEPAILLDRFSGVVTQELENDFATILGKIASLLS